MAIRINKSVSRSMSEIIPDVVTPILKSHGLKTPALFYDWQRIVGEPLAQFTRPLSVTYKKFAVGGGTLHLIIDPSVVLQFQHTQSQILERINTYCGFRAIDRFVIKQEYITSKISLVEAELDQHEVEEVTQALAHFTAPEIASALQRLGEAITLTFKKQTVTHSKK